MFKLIGIIVVVAVVATGFPALQRWYTGEATPQQAVNEIRDSVGQKLISKDEGKGGDTQSTAAGNAAPAAVPGNESHAERVLREMNQKK